jgi:phage gpG-like protein
MPAVLTDRIPEIIASAEAKSAAAVEKTVFDIEASAKQHLTAQGAVDTGNLRGSIQGQMHTAHYGEVATSVEYAHFVEYGTGQRGSESDFEGKPDDITYTESWAGMSARPYMTPAAEEARPGFLLAMTEAWA